MGNQHRAYGEERFNFHAGKEVIWILMGVRPREVRETEALIEKCRSFARFERTLLN